MRVLWLFLTIVNCGIALEAYPSFDRTLSITIAIPTRMMSRENPFPVSWSWRVTRRRGSSDRSPVIPKEDTSFLDYLRVRTRFRPD